MIKRIKQFFSNFTAQKKFVFSEIAGLAATCLLKDAITPLLFHGKSFGGRNNGFQLGMLGLYFLVFSLAVLGVCLLLERGFPSRSAGLARRIEKWRPGLRKIPFEKIATVFALLFFVWLLVKNAWVGDDGFISLRVIDNFFNGYGLVWNVGERVQAFTHPLWLFLLMPLYAALKDPYLAVYWTSLAVSLGAIFLLLLYFARGGGAKLAASLLLASSMAFIDYSSSGLENPLTHLLLMAMLMVVLNKTTTLKSIFFTSLLASLAAVNRLDTILFFIPVLGLQFFELRRSWLKALGLVALGFLPLAAWEAFSLVYYGFPFPNTYYAKLGAANLPADWRRLQAGYYYLNSIRWDPVTLLTIGLSLVVVLLEHRLKKILVWCGMVLYLVYILSIGGDFMSGRFFSAPFILAAALLFSIDYSKLFRKTDFRFFVQVLVLVVFSGLLSRYPPVLLKATDVDKEADAHGIADEKLFYFDYTSWYARAHYQTVHPWGTMGIKFRESGQDFTVFDTIGYFGYYAGPEVYVFDHLALADPLCARLPILTTGRIGHMARMVPAGYEETLMDHFTNHLENPDLRLYYDKLGILIHDDVFSAGRFREILNFNLERYDALIESYVEESG